MLAYSHVVCFNITNMRGLEARLSLPGVLDDVHRASVTAALVEVGLSAGGDDWASLEARVAKYERRPPHRRKRGLSFFEVAYGGGATFGPLFGKNYKLERSSLTDYWADQDNSRVHCRLGDQVLRRQLLISPAEGIDDLREPTRILLVEGILPVALHGSDCEYVGVETAEGSVKSDKALVGDVQDAFGPEAVEWLTEGVADGVIKALRSDTATTPVDFAV